MDSYSRPRPGYASSVVPDYNYRFCAVRSHQKLSLYLRIGGIFVSSE